MSRSTLLMLVFALGSLPACARRLEDQPCPCTDGWTCCASQNRCVPKGDPGSCPGNDTTPVVLPEVCTSDGWCGSKQPFASVWGSADDDIWIVVSDLAGPGSSRPIHFDGTAWSPVTWTSPNPQLFSSPAAVWGTGRNDVFFAGNDGIAHYNGSSWKIQNSDVEFEDHYWAALGGTSATDVWAVGSAFSADLTFPPTGVIGHYNGTQWLTQVIPNVPTTADNPMTYLTGVWAASATDAWAVGVGGTVLHWDGSTWSAKTVMIDGAPLTQNLLGVWGSGSKDVWIVGRAATVLHFDGSRWSRPNIDVDLGALAAAGAFHAVWGSGNGDVWLAGDGGVLIHWDGSHWSAAPSGTTQPLNAVWKSPRGDIWAVGGDATAVHGLGGNWSATPPTPPQLKGLPVATIRANDTNDVWVAGDGLVRHWDGQSWLTCDAQDGWHFKKIQVMGPHDAMIVGSGVGMREYSLVNGVCRVTGSGSGTTMDMHDIWAGAANDIWAVGAQGTVQHFDGASWSDVAVPTTADVISVWESPTDVVGEPIYVWALTGGDTAIRWDGTSWTVLSPLTGLGPFRPGLSWTIIAGNSPYNTWVFGIDNGLSLTFPAMLPISRHWNGSSWAQSVPDDEEFGVVVDSLVTPGGFIGSWLLGNTAFRLGSLGWTAENTGDSNQLVGIASVGEEIWVLGQDGAIMRRKLF